MNLNASTYTTGTSVKPLAAQRINAGSSELSDLFAAMPIVIFLRAARDAIRQRAQRPAVVEAFQG